MSLFNIGDLVNFCGTYYFIKEVWSDGFGHYSYILENHPDNKNYPNLIDESLLKKVNKQFIQLSLF